MSDKNFFLGVGAQKAGTTWLHRYLQQYTNFNFGPLKEYHIWDSVYNWDFVYNSDSKYIRKSRDFISNKARNSDKDHIRLGILDGNPTYEQYFINLIKDNINSTGDITPAYSSLKAEQYNIIKQKLESVGFNIKIIFLMRDPFERCCSAARMKITNKNNSDSSLSSLYSSEPYRDRTNYKHTITELESVFSSNQIYYGIYEEMFTKQKIDELSNFCGVTSNYSYIYRNPNPSREWAPFSKRESANILYEPPSLITSSTIDESLKKEIINFYSEIYEYCYERFPQTKTLWNNTK